MTAPHNFSTTTTVAALASADLPSCTEYQEAVIDGLMPELDGALLPLMATLALPDALALESRVMQAVHACVYGNSRPLQLIGREYPALAPFATYATRTAGLAA